MKPRVTMTLGAVLAPVLLAACVSAPPPPLSGSQPTASTRPDRPSPPAGSVIRFTSGETHIDVTLDPESAAADDLISLLPLTLRFEDFAGKEKIGYLPRKLDHQGAPGSALGRGDFFYYVPWGNIGLWYSDSTAGRSDDTLVLGTFDPSADIEQLDGRDVRIELLP